MQRGVWEEKMDLPRGPVPLPSLGLAGPFPHQHHQQPSPLAQLSPNRLHHLSFSTPPGAQPPLPAHPPHQQPLHAPSRPLPAGGGPQVQHHLSGQLGHVRACNFCRVAHTACDSERPCGRCVRVGRGNLCSDVPSRKRGRPPKVVDGPPVVESYEQPLQQPRRQADAANRNTHIKQEQQPHHLTGGASSADGPQAPNLNASSTSPRSDNTEEKQKKKQKLAARVEPEPSPQREEEEPMSADSKLGLLTRLVEMMSGELRDVKRDNERLRAKVKRLKSGLQDTKSQVEYLLAADRRRTQLEEDEAKRRRDSANNYFNSGSNSATDQQLQQYQQQVLQRFSAPVTALTPGQRPLSALMEVPVLGAAQRHSSWSSTGASSPSPPSTSPSANVPASSFSYELSVLHGGLSLPVITEARHLMPFLGPYNIPSPFAVPDFSFPVCSFLTASIFEDTSPAFAYVNPAFMRLTKYSWNDIIGAPYAMLFAVNEEHYRALAPIMINRPPMTVSDMYRIRVLIRCKDGKLLRVNENVQFFYDQQGNTRYSLMCILDWEEGWLEEGESYGFDHWVPIVKVLSPKIEDVPSHPPSSQNSSSPFDDPTQLYRFSSITTSASATTSEPLSPLDICNATAIGTTTNNDSDSGGNRAPLTPGLDAFLSSHFPSW